MEAIIDFNYYSSHFPCVIKSEEEFKNIEAQAEIELKTVVPEFLFKDIEESRIKDTVFKICNFLYKNKDSLSEKDISSVNNNGYSESYVVKKSEEMQSDLKSMIYSAIGVRLLGVY